MGKWELFLVSLGKDILWKLIEGTDNSLTALNPQIVIRHHRIWQMAFELKALQT